MCFCLVFYCVLQCLSINIRRLIPQSLVQRGRKFRLCLAKEMPGRRRLDRWADDCLLFVCCACWFCCFFVLFCFGWLLVFGFCFCVCSCFLVGKLVGWLEDWWLVLLSLLVVLVAL